MVEPPDGMPVIETPRLRLVPLPLETAEAIVHGHRPADAKWAPDYPTDSTLVAASMVVTAELEDRSPGPWTAYQILRRDSDVAIGGVGFGLVPPDRRGHVHVAFSLVSSADGHGYAAEAVRALIDWAKRQPGVTRVLADTASTNTAGIAVYEDAGMRRAGSDGDLVFFEA